MKKHKNSTRFLQYISGYLSLAILGCSVLGVSLILLSTNKMKQAYSEFHTIQENNINNHLNDQKDIFKDISVRIKTSLYYQPYYINENPINEKNLLKDLSQFRNYSLLIEEYGLYYPSKAAVYMSTAKYSCEYFMRFVLYTDEPFDTLETLFTSIGQNAVIKIPQVERLFAVYPLTLRSASNKSETIYLFFLTSSRSVKERIGQATGVDSDMISFTAKSLPVSFPDALMWDTDTLSLNLAARDNGQLTLFALLSISIVLFVSILLCLLLARSSYQKYSKIDSIGKKLGVSDDGELMILIDQSITGLLDQSYMTNEQLFRLRKEFLKLLNDISDQKESLKSQFLHMVLYQQRASALMPFMVQLGIDMPHACYFVLLIVLEDPSDISMDLSESVEALSDEKASYFWYCQNNNTTGAIIINADKDVLQEDCIEKITNLFSNLDIKAEIYMDRIYTNIEQLCSSYQKMLEQFRFQTQIGSAHIISESRFNMLIYYMQQAETEKCLLTLERIFDEISMYDSSPEMYHLVFDRIVRFAVSCGERISCQYNEKTIKHDCQEIIRSVCSVMSSQIGNKENELSKRIIRCIGDNITNMQFNIDYVADTFSLSNRQIGRIVKKVSGYSFRDYLILQRMEWVSDQLRYTDVSISELAGAIGYSSISHFIKVFKEYSGLTPGDYRRVYKSAANAD